MRYIVAALASVLALAAHAEQPRVEADGAWSRATAPGSSVGVVYVELIARQPDEVVGASTPVAERVEIHATTREDGAMKMRPVPSVSLPAGERVKFEPGGLHLMLVGLHQPLRAGEPFNVTFRFRNAPPLTTQVTVRSPTSSDHAH